VLSVVETCRSSNKLIDQKIIFCHTQREKCTTLEKSLQRQLFITEGLQRNENKWRGLVENTVWKSVKILPIEVVSRKTTFWIFIIWQLPGILQAK